MSSVQQPNSGCSAQYGRYQAAERPALLWALFPEAALQPVEQQRKQRFAATPRSVKTPQELAPFVSARSSSPGAHSCCWQDETAHLGVSTVHKTECRSQALQQSQAHNVAN